MDRGRTEFTEPVDAAAVGTLNLLWWRAAGLLVVVLGTVILILLSPVEGQAAGDLERECDLNQTEVDVSWDIDREIHRRDDVRSGQRFESLVIGLPCFRQSLRRTAKIASENLCLDSARANLCHSDPSSESVIPQLSGDLGDGRFRGVICSVTEKVVSTGNRRNVDDVSEIALHHAGQEHARQVRTARKFTSTIASTVAREESRMFPGALTPALFTSTSIDNPEIASSSASTSVRSTACGTAPVLCASSWSRPLSRAIACTVRPRSRNLLSNRGPHSS